MRILITVLPLLGVALLAACAPSPTSLAEERAAAPTTPAPAPGSQDDPSTGPTGGSSPTADPSPSPTGGTADGTTPVVVTAGEQTIGGVLGPSPAARELAGRLPLTATFRDFNAVEKISPLPGGLPMDGMPEGDDPSPGDIGYYAPTGDLVLYYGDVSYWPGIARLGTLEDTGFLTEADELTLTIARAG